MLAALSIPRPPVARPLPPVAPPPTNTRLLVRASQGDNTALAALYDRHASTAYALALRIVHQPLLAEDVVQETFIRAWRVEPTMAAAVRDPGAWLMRITRNLALDQLRRQAVRPQAVASPEALTLFDEALDPEPEPEMLLSEAARRRAVRRALSELPTEQRGVIELAFFEGLTHQAIADRQGLPLGTVKTRVRLGLRKLAASLAEEIRD